MDRIDNNLEKTHTDIKESNKELTKVTINLYLFSWSIYFIAFILNTLFI